MSSHELHSFLVVIISIISVPFKRVFMRMCLYFDSVFFPLVLTVCAVAWWAVTWISLDPPRENAGSSAVIPAPVAQHLRAWLIPIGWILSGQKAFTIADWQVAAQFGFPPLCCRLWGNLRRLEMLLFDQKKKPIITITGQKSNPD